MGLPAPVRARMIIELADGRAIYWEARNPALAEYETLPLPIPDIGGADVGLVSDWLIGAPMSMAGTVALRIRGGHPWQIRVMQDSGEIPPELAERAVGAIDTMLLPESALLQLRPYLARIAGRQA